MRCPKCRSSAVRERPERTAQGYRRFRCLDCTKQFNERSSGRLNRTQYPSDVIALVVLWRLRYKLSLRDLAELFLIRGFVFTYEAVCDWEAKLTPILAEGLRRSRKDKVGRSWYVDESVPRQAAWVKSPGRERYGKGGLTRQVRAGKTNGSEPLATCRKHRDVIETGLQLLARDEARGMPADCPSGDRHKDGVSPAQALVRNVGTCCLDVKGDLQVVDP